MRYLGFDVSDNADGVVTLEAFASTQSAEHDAVLAEVARVLDWAWHHFPDTHGQIDEGMDWDHDLQDVIEPGGWHAVSLTLTGLEGFAQQFLAEFGDPED